jgi:serine/threonine protein phosphatase PrpC
MNLNAALERVRALLPDDAAAIAFARALPEPLDPVLRDYLRAHLGLWRLRAAHAIDLGAVREHQEDGVSLCPEGRAFAVFDGMGGQSSGIVATEAAQRAFHRCFPRRADQGPPRPSMPPPVEALRLANAAIREGQVFPHQGQAATAALIWSDGDCLHIGHVGDCRVYRLRGERLRLLTRDHSLVNEFERYWRESNPTPPRALTDEELERYQNIVTRALGADVEVEVEHSVQTLEAGDLILLCSDGLWRALDDEALRAALLERPEAPLQARCDALLAAALARAPQDNLALVLVLAED